jgi:hypothetical protein
MNNTDFLQINKIAKVHNDKNIIFCKTDFIVEELKEISKKNYDVVLITGNSDYSITEELAELAPPNIKSWYCQNALAQKNIIVPMPIGIENKLECERSGHGIGYKSRVQEKEDILNSLSFIKETNKFIYCNYNIETNPHYRGRLFSKIKNIKHIHWEEPKLSLSSVFKKFSEYKMVLSPIGNGVDTHRLWEVLYCGSIPLTIKVGNYKIYELYEKLPIIILDDMDCLENKNFLEEQYEIAKNKIYNKEILTTQYWKEKIKNSINTGA